MKKIFFSLICFCLIFLIFFAAFKIKGNYNQKLLLIDFLFEEEIVKKIEDKISTNQISKFYNLRNLEYPNKEEKLSLSKINLKKLNLGKEANKNYLMFEKPQTQKFFIEKNNDRLFFLDSKLNLLSSILILSKALFKTSISLEKIAETVIKNRTKKNLFFIKYSHHIYIYLIL